jgi:hypothetical protein
MRVCTTCVEVKRDVYGIGTKLRIVKMIVVRLLDVASSVGGGGGGGTIPGELICPAKAEALSVKHRIVVAHVWRKVFI